METKLNYLYNQNIKKLSDLTKETSEYEVLMNFVEGVKIDIDNLIK